MVDFYTNVYSHRGKAHVRSVVNGKREQFVAPFKPFVFLPNNGSKIDDGYRTLKGEKVSRMDFASTYEAREFMKQYEDVGSFNIYGTTNWTTQFIKENWFDEIQFDYTLINTVGLDIEVDADETTGFPDIATANLPLTMITLSCRGKYITMGLKVWRPTDPDVTYIMCRDEKHLLQVFIEQWKELDPDIVTGWNIDFFDMPYLVNRINRVLDEDSANALSPWGILEEKTVEIMGRENVTFTPAGITVLDYLRLYKKFSFKNQDSYKLNHIAEIELDEKKIDYSEYGSLKRLYELNFELYAMYNVHDVRLVDKLESKLKFLELVVTLAYIYRTNYEETLSTVRPWESYIHSYLMDRKVVFPQKKVNRAGRELVGGWVKEPIVGLYDWVVSFDLNSLYPNIIRMLNISPETKIDLNFHKHMTVEDHVNLIGYNNGLHDSAVSQNAIFAANGVAYKRDQPGFLPGIIGEVLDGRNIYKDKMKTAKKELEEIKIEMSKRGITV